MGRIQEKLLDALTEYLEGLENPPYGDDEKFLQVAEPFSEKYYAELPPITEKKAKTAEDFLILAEETDDYHKRLKFAKKAYALDKQDIDIALLYIAMTSGKFINYINNMKNLYEETTARFKAEGIFEKYSERFTEKFTNRSYLTMCLRYLDMLTEDKRMRKAAEIAEQILSLDKYDVSKMRYRLMHFYTYFEDEAAAMNLYKRFPNETNCQFLLPLSLLYYKLGDEVKALEWLKKVAANNKDTRKFFNSLGTPKFDEYVENVDRENPREGTIDDFVELIAHSGYLYVEVLFTTWAHNILRSRTGTRGRKTTTKNFYIR